MADDDTTPPALSSAAIQSRTALLPSSQLAEAAERPDCTVFQHVYATPEAILDSTSQLIVYRSVVKVFDIACNTYPDECNEQLRERVLNSDARTSTPGQVRLFQRLYPKLFAMSTVRVYDAASEAVLDTTRKGVMLMLMERVGNNGTLDEQAGRVMNWTMRLSMRDSSPGEAAGGIRLDSQAAAAGADPAAIAPIDRMQLGACTVQQTYRVWA